MPTTAEARWPTRTWLIKLQSFADPITTPDIRAKADTVVAINGDMFDLQALAGRKSIGLNGVGSPDRLRQAIRP